MKVAAASPRVPSLVQTRVANYLQLARPVWTPGGKTSTGETRFKVRHSNTFAT
jgi:hypothetical protein